MKTMHRVFVFLALAMLMVVAPFATQFTLLIDYQKTAYSYFSSHPVCKPQTNITTPSVLPKRPLPNKCAPSIIIVGMARSGTSNLRMVLGQQYANIHMGKAVEMWGLTANDTEKWQQSYECDKDVFSMEKVAAHPWFYSDYASPQKKSHVYSYNKDAVFVLLLRDPIERFVSSFFHLDLTRQRNAKQLLESWAASYKQNPNVTEAVKNLTRVGRKTNAPYDYFDIDIERALSRYLPRDTKSTPQHLIIGVFEEGEDRILRQLEAMLPDTLHRSNEQNHKLLGVLKPGKNSSPRTEGMLSEEVMAVITEVVRSYTNFSAIAELMAGSMGLEHMTEYRLKCYWRTTSGKDKQDCTRCLAGG